MKRYRTAPFFGLLLCLLASPAWGGAEDELFEAARRTALRGEWAPAAEQLNLVLARHPDGAYADDAYFWLGYAYTEMGRYGEAARSYRELLGRFPRSPLREETSIRLARLLDEKLGDPAGAESLYRALAAEKESDPSLRVQAQSGVARVMEKKKDYSAAQQEYSRAGEAARQQLPPGPSQSLAGSKAEARRNFLEENTARDPVALGLFTDAESLFGAGRSAEAEAVLRGLIANHPRFPSLDRALVLLARVLDRQGRSPEAAEIMADAERRFPGSEATAAYRKELRTLRALDRIELKSAP